MSCDVGEMTILMFIMLNVLYPAIKNITMRVIFSSILGLLASLSERLEMNSVNLSSGGISSLDPALGRARVEIYNNKTYS